MIESFAVRNYRSFKSEGRIELSPGRSRNKTDHINNDCLKITAILGANASGKSNLIHGLETMKELVTNPLYCGKDPIHSWDSEDAITNFSISFIKSGKTYRYELDVESVETALQDSRKTIFLYPVRGERLYVADMKYESDGNGNLPWETVLERTECKREPNLYTEWCHSEIHRLRSRLNYFNTFSREMDLQLAQSMSSDRKNEVDSSMLEQESRRKKKKYDRERYELRKRIKNIRNGFQKNLLLDTWLPLTLMFGRQGAVEEPETHAMSNKRIKLDSEQSKHFRNVFDWFNSNLKILDTNDIYMKDSNEALERMSDIVRSLDLGLDELKWHETTLKRQNSVYDSLSLNDQLILDQMEEAARCDHSETRRVVKSNRGIFRFTFGPGKTTTEELLPKHSNGVDSELYSESDGTVRVIELASVLVPTDEDMTFVIDEIDRRLHPKLTSRFIELHLRDESPLKQVIFSTHDTEILTTELFRKDEIWLVDKVDGASYLRSLDTLNGINYNRRLERLYLDDKALPGIPKVTTARNRGKYEDGQRERDRGKQIQSCSDDLCHMRRIDRKKISAAFRTKQSQWRPF